MASEADKLQGPQGKVREGSDYVSILAFMLSGYLYSYRLELHLKKKKEKEKKQKRSYKHKETKEKPVQL